MDLGSESGNVASYCVVPYSTVHVFLYIQYCAVVQYSTCTAHYCTVTAVLTATYCRAYSGMTSLGFPGPLGEKAACPAMDRAR